MPEPKTGRRGPRRAGRSELARRPTADAMIATLMSVMDSAAAGLGARCEVVLHDFRRPERSIVAIAGNVTGRRPGGSVTQIGLSIMKAGDNADPFYSYVTSAPNGCVLKSVTVPLRDEAGHVFGALCVNIDVTELWALGKGIEALLGRSEVAPRPVTFVDDIDGVIADVLKEETRMLGRPLTELSRAERLRLIRALDFRGVFSLQRSIPQVARYLGLSRATLYNDLKQMRRENGADRPPITRSTRASAESSQKGEMHDEV